MLFVTVTEKEGFVRGVSDGIKIVAKQSRHILSLSRLRSTQSGEVNRSIRKGSTFLYFLSYANSTRARLWRAGWCLNRTPYFRHLIYFIYYFPRIFVFAILKCKFFSNYQKIRLSIYYDFKLNPCAMPLCLYHAQRNISNLSLYM